MGGQEKRYPFDPDNPVPKGVNLHPRDLRSKYYKVGPAISPNLLSVVSRSQRLHSPSFPRGIRTGLSLLLCGVLPSSFSPLFIITRFSCIISQVIEPEAKFYAGDPRYQRDRRRERDPKRTNHFKKLRVDPQEVYE